MFSFRLKGCLPAEVEVCAVLGIYESYTPYTNITIKKQCSRQFTIQTIQNNSLIQSNIVSPN